MLKAGFASVSFRKKTPKEIIELTAKAGLDGIEWASDAHVHEGDVKLAREVADMTKSAGLEVSSYGSYYALGSKQDITPFLESAAALGAKQMRIWPGHEPSCYLSHERRMMLVDGAINASRKAAEYGITLSTECHSYSLNDNPASQALLLLEVNEKNFCTYWQALTEIPLEQQMHSLKAIYATGKLTNLHVYWIDDKRERCLLEDAKDIWAERFSLFKNDDTVRYAMIEFVKDDADENFYRDAKALRELIDSANR